MKKLKVYLGFVFLTLLIVATFSSCADKKSSNSTPTATYANINGICVNTANNNQQVDSSLCGMASGVIINGVCMNQSTNTQLPMTSCAGVNANNSGYVCYSTTTGQQVPSTYCATNANTANNSFTLYNGACYVTATSQPTALANCANQSGGQQCNGTYYYQSAGGYQAVQCSGTNCRNYTLIDSSGRSVTCQ